ncbi:hypothetical protein GCM10023175_61780 [Pseudonocardia xishanensis]|uniref:Uncharacterized protein n=1 Tax=Pseudonocardia xishanensis TaxID=630995 RepID=A0ABP8S0Z2_9PSEU
MVAGLALSVIRGVVDPAAYTTVRVAVTVPEPVELAKTRVGVVDAAPGMTVAAPLRLCILGARCDDFSPGSTRRQPVPGDRSRTAWPCRRTRRRPGAARRA